MRKKKSETRKRTIEREKWTTTELQIDFEKWFYFISFALNLTLSVCEYFIKSDLSIFFPHFYDFVCVRVRAPDFHHSTNTTALTSNNNKL